MGDGKIYLNDDDEACKIDSRGVPYKVGSDGRRILPSRRPIHKYTPEEWKKMGEAEKKAAYKKDKRDKARSAKKERKKAAMGKKVISKVLEQMIFPKIVQCSAVDLRLNAPVDEDDAWAWAFLADVIPAVPAHMVFRRELDPINAVRYIGDIGTQRKKSRSQVVLQRHGHATSHSQRNDEQSQSNGSFHEGVERIVGSRSIRLHDHSRV